MSGQYNSARWKDWRLAALISEEAKDKEKEMKDAPEIGAQKISKPKTDNEGKREVVQVNGIRFSLDADNVTSKTGHTISWSQIKALYEYGKEKGYFKE